MFDPVPYLDTALQLLQFWIEIVHFSLPWINFFWQRMKCRTRIFNLLLVGTARDPYHFMSAFKKLSDNRYHGGQVPWIGSCHYKKTRHSIDLSLRLDGNCLFLEAT